MGFPGSSAGKESACNVGDPSLIPGLGRSPGEGIGYPLEYSWASLVAQMVKNLPAMQETWVWLGWEDPLEKGTATHSSILAWRIPWTDEPGRLQSMGSQRVRHNWATFTHSLMSGEYFMIPFTKNDLKLCLYFETLSLFPNCYDFELYWNNSSSYIKFMNSPLNNFFTINS